MWLCRAHMCTGVYSLTLCLLFTICLAWANGMFPCIRKFPRACSHPSRVERMKTTITGNYPDWSHGSQPHLTQWNHEPLHVRPPKTDRSWWRVLTKHGPLEKGMANHLVFLPWEPHEQCEEAKRTLKDELPRWVGSQYVTGDQWRNNSRKNEETEPKQKQHPVVDVTGDGNKVLCCKEQYCIGTWNGRSMNQENWKWSNRRWQEWTYTF